MIFVFIILACQTEPIFGTDDNNLSNLMANLDIYNPPTQRTFTFLPNVLGIVAFITRNDLYKYVSKALSGFL